jgi:hypothetical protein
MFLTLVVVPIVYTWVDRWKVLIPAFFEGPFALLRLRRMKARRRETTEAGQ